MVTALAYGAVVLVAAFAPPVVFAALLLATAALAISELVALRRAGVVAALQALVLGAGLLSLWFLRDLSDPYPSFALLVVILAIWAADVAAYAEMWATEVLWPDFSVADLDAALASYAARERRFGR